MDVIGSRACRRDIGFTLVELLVSIALMSLMAGYFIYNRLEALKQELAENIAQETLSLSNLAVRYYLDHSGSWPGSAGGGDCSNAISQMTSPSSEYLPGSYSSLASYTPATKCNMTSDLANPLQFKLTFGTGEADLAKMVQALLPMASYDDTSGTPELTYNAIAPRREGRIYSFHLLNLNSDSNPFNVKKPDCNNAELILIPQSMCVFDTKGLQGYYFKKEDATVGSDKYWRVTMYVGVWKDGTGSNPPEVKYNPQTVVCDSENVEVGAIAYCN